MDNVDRLYQIYSILAEAGENVSDHEPEFMEIINLASQDGSGGKGLACQFIPKFIKHFPHLSVIALETQIDLAEDVDVNVRKMAIKNLPLFCKATKQYVRKIADILTQLLQTEDSAECTTVQAALMAVMEVDVQGTLHGILSQVSTAQDDVIRKRAIEFLNSKLKVLPEDLLTKEVEEFLLEASKKVFIKVSGQDFLNLLHLVTHLKIAKTIPVQKTVVEIIAVQLDVDVEFGVSVDNITGFMHFLNQACPLFSHFVNSNKFVHYIFMKVFPKLDEIKTLDNGHDLVLDIFKGLAEIVPFVHKDNETKACAEIVFIELLKYLPLPPDPENINDSNIEDANLFFTHIECLLFTFIQFLKHDDSIVTATDNVDRFKDLKFRLQFLARVIMHVLKGLKDAKKTTKVIDNENEESKLKAIAAHTLNNINALIKDFFRSPLSFKTTITFSWKPAAHSPNELDAKRPFEASSSANKFSKRRRACMEIYVPPSGKYSSRLDFSSLKDNTVMKEKGSSLLVFI